MCLTAMRTIHDIFPTIPFADETNVMNKLVEMVKSSDRELCGMLLCNLTRIPKGW
jgi:hypothetical protein